MSSESPRRPARLDLVFYTGNAFPATYKQGAFVVRHGTGNKSGYNVVFVPFNHLGKAGAPTVFADGFAGFDPASLIPGRPTYRPIGPAVVPDGALYVAESQKGRLWPSRTTPTRRTEPRSAQWVHKRDSRPREES